MKSDSDVKDEAATEKGQWGDRIGQGIVSAHPGS